MNDLIARLKLDSKQWDNNISKANRSVKQLQSVSKGSFNNIGNSISSLGGTLGKFAGWLGVGVSAIETLNKAINSSSKTQELYNDVIGTSSKVTDQFFQSLISGDWTRFNSGILDAINNAREYTKAYRDVMNMLQVTASEYEDLDAEKTELESIVEDERKNIEERKKANEKLQQLLKDGRETIKHDTDIAINELNNMIATDAGSNQFINADNAKQYIRDLRNEYSDLNKQLSKYIEMRDKATTRLNNPFKYSGDEAYRIQQQAANEFYSTYSPEQRAYYEELERLNQSITDETYQRYEELIDKISQLRNQSAQWAKDATGAMDEITSAVDEINKSNIEAEKKKKEIINEGSIKAIQQTISKLQEQYFNASNEGTRAGLFKAIHDAETLLKMMLNRAQGTELIKSHSFNSTSYRNPTEDIKSGYINIKPIPNDTIESNNEYAESLNGIANVMGNITQMTNDGASAWLTYSANILSTIGTAIPQIQALTTALQAKAIAEAAGSAASVPVTGWITAISAIAALMAAFAAVPKFATGGIVDGNSFVGDKVLARLNSGEMILNKRQQGNLFNLLNSNPNNQGNMTGKVEFIIEGKTLKGVLKNYDSKLSKY